MNNFVYVERWAVSGFMPFSINHQGDHYLLSQYHSIVPEGERLEWADVTNLSFDFWYRDTFQHSTQVPRQIKLKAIEHHHLILRADEEIALVKKEMLASLMFYFKDWRNLQMLLQTEMQIFHHFMLMAVSS